MRQTPIQPVVRLALAKILNEHFGMRGVKAGAVATKIIELLREKNFDIVKGDWMAGEADKPKLRWEDLAEIVAGYEAEGRTPWNTPEIQ